MHGPKEDVLSAHTLLALHQNISRKYEQLSKVCDFNKYTMRVLRSVEAPKPATADGSDDDNDDGDDDGDDALDGGLLLVRAGSDDASSGSDED